MRSNTNFQARLQFDSAASLYDAYRPSYPEELIKDIIEAANLSTKSAVLDIGCGTGQATSEFAKYGFKIDAIEPGDNLARIASKNLSKFPNVKIIQDFFENFAESSETYDCIVSANAFHWIDPLIGYAKVARLLKPSGVVALFWNFPVLEQQAFAILRKIVEPSGGDLAIFSVANEPSESMLKGREEMANTGFFDNFFEKEYVWSNQLSADEICGLLATYANYAALNSDSRATIFKEYSKEIENQLGGSVILSNTACLRVAKKKICKT